MNPLSSSVIRSGRLLSGFMIKLHCFFDLFLLRSGFIFITFGVALALLLIDQKHCADCSLYFAKSINSIKFYKSSLIIILSNLTWFCRGKLRNPHSHFWKRHPRWGLFLHYQAYISQIEVCIRRSNWQSMQKTPSFVGSLARYEELLWAETLICCSYEDNPKTVRELEFPQYQCLFSKNCGQSNWGKLRSLISLSMPLAVKSLILKSDCPGLAVLTTYYLSLMPSFNFAAADWFA